MRSDDKGENQPTASPRKTTEGGPWEELLRGAPLSDPLSRSIYKDFQEANSNLDKQYSKEGMGVPRAISKDECLSRRVT